MFYKRILKCDKHCIRKTIIIRYDSRNKEREKEVSNVAHHNCKAVDFVC